MFVPCGFYSAPYNFAVCFTGGFSSDFDVLRSDEYFAVRVGLSISSNDVISVGKHSLLVMVLLSHDSVPRMMSGCSLAIRKRKDSGFALRLWQFTFFILWLCFVVLLVRLTGDDENSGEPREER